MPRFEGGSGKGILRDSDKLRPDFPGALFFSLCQFRSVARSLDALLDRSGGGVSESGVAVFLSRKGFDRLFRPAPDVLYRGPRPNLGPKIGGLIFFS